MSRSSRQKSGRRSRKAKQEGIRKASIIGKIEDRRLSPPASDKSK